MNSMPVYINNRFVRNEEARLHISDLSMQRGYAVFDFFRTLDGRALFMNDHLDRFYSSAQALHLKIRQTREELSAVIHELIKQSGLPEVGIRLMLTGGYSSDSYKTADPNLVISCNPVTVAGNKDFEKGLSVITYNHQRELPHVKTINYQTALWLQPLLKEKQADDVLYYKDNFVTEFPRSNVFIVTREKKLITPAANMLYGITRKKVLSLAAEIMQVEEKPVTLIELMDADEVFLTSTTKKILPVIKINDRVISGGKPGGYTTMLYEKFLQLEKSSAHLVSL